jgi:hypothetical protein
MLNRQTIWVTLLASAVLALASWACCGTTPSTRDLSTAETTPLPGDTAFKPTATSPPFVPTVDVSGCTLGAVFAADVTIPDNTPINAGVSFVKTWSIRNAGTCDWGPGYQLTFIDGDQMGGPQPVSVPEAAAGATVEVSVELVAPAEAGTYRGNWQMCVNETKCFGDKFYVQIVSSGMPASELKLVQSLAEFEASQFCREYNCVLSDSWDLRKGGINNSYDTDVSPEVSVEVTTVDGIPTEAGLVFYYRPKLSADDLQLVYLFLESFHPGVKVDTSVKTFIERNVEIDVFQICEADSIEFGSVRVWAGKVLEQTVHIGPDCPSESGDKTITEWEGVYIGMPADDVLRIHPKDEMTEESEVLGTDSEGLVVRWTYPGAYLTFAIREGECPEGVDSLSCHCYRVIEIQLR